MPKLLEIVQKQLGWPGRQEILSPKGPGPRMVAELAKRKLGIGIKRLGIEAEVGVLAANPASERTEDPLGIICEFNNNVDDEVIRETQRLAWSFSRSPMLITIEPNLLRVWTCWKRPPEKEEDLRKLRVEQLQWKGGLSEENSLSDQAARALRWVELASGNFFRNPAYSKYFKRNQRADRLMLEDLRELRKRLLKKNLPEDICHDLIARIIFIAFLFQRKDSHGNAALDEAVLANLAEKGVLSKVHKDFRTILDSHAETYRFFRELNNRFNGDLFPGKGATEDERNREWKAEMDQVKEESHLKLLAEFVSGKMEMRKSQYCLWARYAFDAIPLEFISSIYEEFAKAGEKETRGVHYTPAHVVDLVLDEVLPWEGKKWDLKVLDPACGSGIFLVKAYQRLLHRWKQAHGNKPNVEDLRSLLEKNLFGVDLDPDAVRVASFSLYLAMCDEIEPKHVWQKRVRFPRLRDKRLINADFFTENKDAFRTDEDANTYDLVIGNPPWGRGEVTPPAEAWAKRDPSDVWPIQYNCPGLLFLVKAACLTRASGCIAVIQPAQALLTNRQNKAMAFRKKLFSRFKVDGIVNLSAFRFKLFKDSISPACIVCLRPKAPDGEPLKYVCPKPTGSRKDHHLIIVEPHDVNNIFSTEAAEEVEVWSSLMWGGRRDFLLIERLKEKNNLGKLAKQGALHKRQGIVRGDRRKKQPKIVGRRILETDAEPPGSFLFLSATDLPKNLDEEVHSRDSTDFAPFEVPQLVVKQSWKSKARFRSFLIRPDEMGKGIICSKSYVSIHGTKGWETQLEAACLSFNSILAVYYLFLTSGRCAGFIPEAYVEEIISLPIPEAKKGLLDTIKSYQDIDHRVREALRVKEAEWVLVEDFLNYTLPDFKGGPASPGRQSTRAACSGVHENVLKDYCEYFRRVLQAGFGKDKEISATIFSEGEADRLPVRLVGIHLEPLPDGPTRIERMDSPKLIELLKKLDGKYLEDKNNRAGGGILYRRVARVYDTIDIEGKKIPTIFIVKPDQIRYWTRSMAMRDADEVAADIILWRERAER